MTTIAHIVSGSYIAVRVANVAPSELDYILIALISGGILDLDHLYYYVKDRAYYKKHGYVGHMHKARSPLHELLGFFIIGLGMWVISFFNVTLALVAGLPAMIHQIEDIIMGISMPFSPFDKTEIKLLPQRKNIKIIVDIVVITVFGGLWIQYLNAAH
jgi:hypothetical protein